MTDHVQMSRITITTTMQTVFEVPDGVTIEQVRHLALPVLSEDVNETDALAILQQKAIDQAYLGDANGVHLSVEHTITDGCQLEKDSPSALTERDERAEFEAYAIGKGWQPHHLKQRSDGNYEDWGVNPEWRAWQARAALEQQR